MIPDRASISFIRSKMVLDRLGFEWGDVLSLHPDATVYDELLTSTLFSAIDLLRRLVLWQLLDLDNIKTDSSLRGLLDD